MPIFKTIPATRVPGQYAEFAKAPLSGLSTLDYKVLIIGQGTDAGTKDAKELHLLSSADQAAEYFGIGSMIHLQAIKYFDNNLINEVKAIAATMDPVAVATSKATGSIQITAAATGNGTLAVYVGGQRIAVAVTAGDVVGTISQAIKDKIDADLPNLPVKSTVVTDTVNFECLNIGLEYGDDIDIRVSYNDGESLPAGVTVAITAMNGGTATPDITDGSPSLIGQLGDIWFHVIAFPYTDTTNFTAMTTELDRRFGATEMIDGLAITCLEDTHTNLVTYGSAKNTNQISVVGKYDVMQSGAEVSAAMCGQVAGSLSSGPGSESLPFQTLPLVGISAPEFTKRFTFTERESLLNNGIATIKTDDGGVVRIERLITTYQTNESSAPDETWLDANTRFTAMFIRWDWVTYLKTKYGRAKIADTSARILPGQTVMTPELGAAEALSRFALWEGVALVENLLLFKEFLISVRDVGDVNAMNWVLRTDFVNQFRVGKTQISLSP